MGRVADGSLVDRMRAAAIAAVVAVGVCQSAVEPGRVRALENLLLLAGADPIACNDVELRQGLRSAESVDGPVRVALRAADDGRSFVVVPDPVAAYLQS